MDGADKLLEELFCVTCVEWNFPVVWLFVPPVRWCDTVTPEVGGSGDGGVALGSDFM